jgi:hypothetical protein
MPVLIPKLESIPASAAAPGPGPTGGPASTQDFSGVLAAILPQQAKGPAGEQAPLAAAANSRVPMNAGAVAVPQASGDSIAGRRDTSAAGTMVGVEANVPPAVANATAPPLPAASLRAPVPGGNSAPQPLASAPGVTSPADKALPPTGLELATESGAVLAPSPRSTAGAPPATSSTGEPSRPEARPPAKPAHKESNTVTNPQPAAPVTPLPAAVPVAVAPVTPATHAAAAAAPAPRATAASAVSPRSPVWKTPRQDATPDATAGNGSVAAESSSTKPAARSFAGLYRAAAAPGAPASQVRSEAVVPVTVAGPAHGNMAAASAGPGIGQPAGPPPSPNSNPFHHLDSGGQPPVLQATPQRLSVAVPDSSLGQLQVRAQSVGGHVEATLSASTAESHARLAGQAAALSTYMHQQAPEVSRVTVERLPSSSMQNPGSSQQGSPQQRPGGQSAGGGNAPAEERAGPAIAAGSAASAAPLPLRLSYIDLHA